jgi:hypothetical protein
LFKQHLHENCTNNLPCLGSVSFDGLRRFEAACRRYTDSDASCRAICTRTRRTRRARSNSCDDSNRAARLVAGRRQCRERLCRKTKKQSSYEGPRSATVNGWNKL